MHASSGQTVLQVDTSWKLASYATLHLLNALVFLGLAIFYHRLPGSFFSAGVSPLFVKVICSFIAHRFQKEIQNTKYLPTLATVPHERTATSKEKKMHIEKIY